MVFLPPFLKNPPSYGRVAALGLIALLFPASWAQEFVDQGQVTYTTVVSEQGFFSCDFYGAGTGLPGTIDMDGTYKYRASAFTSDQMNAIMRAVNTLEKTFVFATNTDGKPVRQAQLRFAISITGLASEVAAAAQPIISTPYYGKTVPRTTWLESDFGGRKTGETAVVNNLESVLKYGTDVYYMPSRAAFPEYSMNSVAGTGDAYLLFNASQFNPDGSSTSTLMSGIETTALHELGHAMGFMHNANSAMGAFMEVHNDSFGEPCYYFNGETAIKCNGGEMPQMNDLAMDHLGKIYPDAVMSAWTTTHDTKFTDLDLALFQDMGWTIRDSAWTNLPVPEPCSSLLAAAGAVGAAWRRRR